MAELTEAERKFFEKAKSRTSLRWDTKKKYSTFTNLLGVLVCLGITVYLFNSHTIDKIWLAFVWMFITAECLFSLFYIRNKFLAYSLISKLNETRAPAAGA